MFSCAFVRLSWENAFAPFLVWHTQLCFSHNLIRATASVRGGAVKSFHKARALGCVSICTYSIPRPHTRTKRHRNWPHSRTRIVSWTRMETEQRRGNQLTASSYTFAKFSGKRDIRTQWKNTISIETNLLLRSNSGSSIDERSYWPFSLWNFWLRWRSS